MQTPAIATEQDFSYPPARGPVLLLSCMDLRLVDDVVRFMEHDGLTNRYDHTIMAGAALGALGQKNYEHWHQTFMDHLCAACDLHHIKDVYILEHRDCGAYRMFLGEEGTFDDDQYDKEKDQHCLYANKLAGEIEKWVAKEKRPKLTVKSFLMDLRGHVSFMARPKPKRTVKKTKKRQKNV